MTAATEPAPHDDSVVERVAKAIWARRETRLHGMAPKPGWWEAQGEPLRERMRDLARAALAAIGSDDQQPHRPL